MILTDVRDYLKSHGQAPLRDMALAFGMDQEALRPLLDYWATRGKVIKLPPGTACGGSCSACAPQTIEIYRWIDSSQ
ncbi:MAG: putative ferrous iron transport protein [Pseudomonadota bacterium]|nr:putative ferrous iron transport protein [Pseudomonadota bacterium]